MRQARISRFRVKQPRFQRLPYVECPTVTEAYDRFIRTGEFSFGMSSDSEYDGKGDKTQFDLDSVVPNQDLLKAAAVAGRTPGMQQTAPEGNSQNNAPAAPAPAPAAPAPAPAGAPSA